MLMVWFLAPIILARDVTTDGFHRTPGPLAAAIAAALLMPAGAYIDRGLTLFAVYCVAFFSTGELLFLAAAIWFLLTDS